MANSISNFNSAQAYQNTKKLDIQLQTHTQQTSQKHRPDLPDQASPIAQMAVDKTFHSAKLQQQASVITHLFNQGSQQDIELFSMKVNYQSAIEAINEKLRADLGLDPETADPVSQNKLQEQGGMEYWTPENTAKRIVEGATAFLGGFQAANPDLQGEELMTKFMDVVGGGLIQGFAEAKGFLGDLKVFEGTVEQNYNATFELVQAGMEQFRKDFLGISDEASETQTNELSNNESTESTEATTET